MPVLRSIRERFARERPLDGVRVAACLHVTAETANLVRTLVAGGAEVGAVRGQPAVDPGRRRRGAGRADGAEVLGAPRRGPRRLRRQRRALVDAPGRTITLDDGADLLVAPARRRRSCRGPARRHRGDDDRPRAPARARGGRSPACPVIAVNEARTERLFNDRYGTGQSTLDGILRATNLLLAGRTVVVLGYGCDRPRHRRRAPAAPGRRSSSARSTRCARSRRAWRASR